MAHIELAGDALNAHVLPYSKREESGMSKPSMFSVSSAARLAELFSDLPEQPSEATDVQVERLVKAFNPRWVSSNGEQVGSAW